MTEAETRRLVWRRLLRYPDVLATILVWSWFLNRVTTKEHLLKMQMDAYRSGMNPDVRFVDARTRDLLRARSRAERVFAWSAAWGERRGFFEF